MPDKSAKASVRVVVSGRVQGVLFRVFAVREGNSLGLCGMARNLSDGRVEVIAEGPKDRLETLVTRLRKGPSAALVQQVVEDWGEYQHEYDSFQIEYT